MKAKIQRRFVVFAIMAMVAVLVPASLAAGSHEDEILGSSSVMLLTMGQQDHVSLTGFSNQSIATRRNDCTWINGRFGSTLLRATPTGGPLGETKDGIGVQGSGDGSGENCGRVEGSDEKITLTLGTSLPNHLMTAVDLDLELKFNAVVKVTYLRDGHTVPVATDTFNPMNTGSDDGPDSKDGDNYRYYTYRTGSGVGSDPTDPIQFDTVVLEAISGAFSLEGGADLATNDDPVAFGALNPLSKSSQIEVRRVFDGEIDCGDTEPISEDGIDTSGVVTMHSENLGAGWLVEPNCQLKPFSASVTDTSLTFVPELADSQARYTMEITVDEQTIVVDSTGTITSLTAVYDPEPGVGFPDTADETALKACLGQPLLDQSDLVAYQAFWQKTDVELLPSGESACFYHASVEPTSDGVGTESWGIYFEDDPGFSFK